jgi:hypothetical protein
MTQLHVVVARILHNGTVCGYCIAQVQIFLSFSAFSGGILGYFTILGIAAIMDIFPNLYSFITVWNWCPIKKNYLNEWYTVFFQLLELIYYIFFNFIELIYISIFILIRLLQKGLCIFHTIWFSALQLKHCIIAVIMCDVAPLLGCFALCIIVYISLSLSLSLSFILRFKSSAGLFLLSLVSVLYSSSHRSLVVLELEMDAACLLYPF